MFHPNVELRESRSVILDESAPRFDRDGPASQGPTPSFL